jgi:hypothetical protein
MSALQNAEALRDYRISRTLGFMRGGPPPGWREDDDDEAARQVPLDSMKRRTPDRDARSCEPKTHSELSGPIAFRGTKNRKKFRLANRDVRPTARPNGGPDLILRKMRDEIEPERGLSWMTGGIRTRAGGRLPAQVDVPNGRLSSVHP